MTVLQSSPETIAFTLLCEADLPTLHDWLLRAHVRAWWDVDDDEDLEDTREHFGPMTDPAARTRGYVARLDGNPIGFVQCYVVAGSGEGWWPDETDPGARGIDVLLADGDTLSRGLGTRMVQAFVSMLFEDPLVTKVQADPKPDNSRAIRCFEKSGFSHRGRVNTPDGEAMLMVRTRQ